jgi:2-polyprenyl-3-methyl-5-hydroxy-6-metoxy-1,4-benzoquinol methylase
MRCAGCGLVVRADIWRPCINETMEEAWFGDNWNPASSIWVRFLENLRDRRTFRRIRRVRAGGSMLEIGFGSGSFLAYMRTQGWRVQGCDASKAVCERAARQLDIPAHCGEVDGLPADARYDLVVMNHVLEHVQDPLGTLAAIRRRMKPGARLHIAVPNIECWESGLPGWIGYQPYHLTYFSRETLCRAVRDAGLEVEAISTHEQPASWYLAVLATMLPALRGEARRRMRTALHARRRVSFVEHAYRLSIVTAGALTWPLRRVQERFGRGDEVIVLARNI